MNAKFKTWGMSGNTLKLIAITAMLIDHIAWPFVQTSSALGQIMHIIGRLTAPIMCYFIAEGYYRTRSVKRYALRLFAFALISHIPFVLFQQRSLTLFPMNMIYTLFFGLIALWAYDKLKSEALKVIVVIACCFATIQADWAIIGVLFILAFGLNRGNFAKQAQWFTITAVSFVALATIALLAMEQNPLGQLFQLGTLLSLPLLKLYNGQRGGYAWSKWLFYIFYPAHILILAIIVIYIK